MHQLVSSCQRKLVKCRKWSCRGIAAGCCQPSGTSAASKSAGGTIVGASLRYIQHQQMRSSSNIASRKRTPGFAKASIEGSPAYMRLEGAEGQSATAEVVISGLRPLQSMSPLLGSPGAHPCTTSFVAASGLCLTVPGLPYVCCLEPVASKTEILRLGSPI